MADPAPTTPTPSAPVAIFPNTGKPPASPLEVLMMDVAKRLAAANAEVSKRAGSVRGNPGHGGHEAAHTHAKNAAASLGDVEGGLNRAWWGLRAAQDHADKSASALKGV